MSKILEQQLQLAWDGRTYFMNWLSEFQISDQDAIWLFTGMDSERELFFNYTEEFKHQPTRPYDRIIIILPNNCNINPELSISEPCCFVPLDQIAAVIRLYALYPFSSRLIICDLDEPEGRMGHQLLQTMNCTLENMIRFGILNIKESKK